MTKETIYISANLKNTKFGKPVVAELRKKLEPKGYAIIEIENHNNNDWCRDFMPVKAPGNKLVKFRYEPIYLTETEKWKKTIPHVWKVLEELKIKGYQESDLILDGGAIEVFGSQAIVSDRVLRENKNPNIREVLSRLKNVLSLDRLIVVPEYPDDFTGHVDGIVRFIDENTVLVNDEKPNLNIAEEPNFYKRKMHNNWYYSFLTAIENHGLKTEKIPMALYDDAKKDNLGLYINFLKLDEYIVMPAYLTEDDDKAAAILEKLYKRPVIRINSRELTKNGGMINCILWEKK